MTQSDVHELVELMREAASAYIGGDIRRYFELMQHADDFTLMDPFGGDTSRESGASDERIAALEEMFRGGECELDVVQTYTSGNLTVLVVVERQRGDVGGFSTQDWSLARDVRVSTTWMPSGASCTATPTHSCIRSPSISSRARPGLRRYTPTNTCRSWSSALGSPATDAGVRCGSSRP